MGHFEEERWLRAERVSRARTEGELEVYAQSIVQELSQAGLMVWQAQEILNIARELLLWQCLGGQ